MDVSCGKVVKENLRYKNVPTCGFFVFANYSSRVLGVEERGGGGRKQYNFSIRLMKVFMRRSLFSTIANVVVMSRMHSKIQDIQ